MSIYTIEELISKNNKSADGTKRYAYIRSVPRPSAQGRHLHTTRDGRIMGKTKSKGAATYFTPSISVKHNQLNTGFWQTIRNPYKTDKPDEIGLPNIWINNEIHKQDEITLQEYLEIKYNHEPGFFSSEKPNIRNRKGAKATYMQSFIYPLYDGTNTLDLDNERDEVMYICAITTDKIANSKDLVNPVTHTHYISQVNESAQEKAAKLERVETAVGKVIELKTKYDSETLKKMCTILGLTTGNVSTEALKVKLSDFINDKANQDKHIDDLNYFWSLMTGNKNDKYRFETYYLLQELVNNRIVYSERGKHIWGNAPTTDLQTIGLSRDHTVEWLTSGEAREWRNTLIEELQAKTGIVLK